MEQSGNVKKNSKEQLDDIINCFHEFNDSFEDNLNTEIQSITKTINKNNGGNEISNNARNNDQTTKKIQIVQDVFVSNNKTLLNQVEMNTNHENNYLRLSNIALSPNSDDVVDSDSDIVEATPEKPKPQILQSLYVYII